MVVIKVDTAVDTRVVVAVEHLALIEVRTHKISGDRH
jgi:hypothetical protein